MNHEMEKKLSTIDILKPLMMIMVVVYHVCLAWETSWSPVAMTGNPGFCKTLDVLASWLNTVHVPAFVFASGFLFYYLRYKKNKYRAGFGDIKKRAERLLIPYCIFSFFWAAPIYWFIFRSDFFELFKKFVLGIAPAQLWFLLMLFWVFCFFYFFSDALDRLPALTRLLLLFFFSVMGGLAPTLSGMFKLFQFAPAVKHLLFFYLGGVFARAKFELKSGVALIMLVISFIGVYFIDHFGFLKVVAFPVFSCMSCVGLYSMLYCMNSKVIAASALFQILRKNSFPIFLIHQQLLQLLIVLFSNVCVPPVLLWFVLFSLTLSGSILLSLIIKTLPGGKRVLGLS